ncbi:MAG: hypothetical protein H0W64_07075 [Gammaproteobacteria bacterium]|nr:hypothetical protein [Gammaproteobacteria bacterium]
MTVGSCPKSPLDMLGNRHHLYEKFELVSLFQSEEATSSFSHKTQIMRKLPKDNQITNDPLFSVNWVVKEALIAGQPAWSNWVSAYIELVTQEFLRLFNQWTQPKTRLLLDLNRNPFIASKKICLNPYKNLSPFAFDDRIKTSDINNLGRILVLALFQNERDLKFGNLNGNAFDCIVKIDGDHSLYALGLPLDQRNSQEFTAHDLQALPDVVNYTPYNWLYYIKQEKRTLHGSSFHADLPSSPFRIEIHKTTLELLLLPEKMFEQFSSFYIPEDEVFEAISSKSFFKAVADMYLARQQILLKAALEYDAFKLYLFKENHQELIEGLADMLTRFQGKGKINPFPILNKTSLIEDLNDNLAALMMKYEVSRPLPSQVKNFPKQSDNTFKKIKHNDQAEDQPILLIDCVTLQRNLSKYSPTLFNNNINNNNTDHNNKVRSSPSLK